MNVAVFQYGFQQSYVAQIYKTLFMKTNTDNEIK